ncbi:Carboxypeptidase regulatory-like domain-containing protein [Rhodoferax sp. OV413]|uniref:carboxypeptidase-like regulatory domain-containing protein n=1 Tax=Rhodoferax sp. OV413 TaxID=1855285 RepID=UPI00088A649E|nr:carboxypeptidase-like regulatory domain-containing protein [Rhodoferax sp. OV413]SDP94255.1 Carboxypeptidase regulatory-like domain-containing protein [Rhodoferax sp. OV413]
MSIRQFVAACIAFLCLHALAQTTGKFSFTDLRITGRVVDAGTGAPLEGVVVSVIDPRSPQPPASTTTNADGKYNLAINALISPPLNLKVKFSKTGWGPDPRELVANLSKSPQIDILLADLKGNSNYYKALADATVKNSVANVAVTPPQLEPLLSLPPERKAETLRAIQAVNLDVYAGVQAADRNYARVKQLREKFAATLSDVTADPDWKNPGQVVLTGSVRSEADKAKLLEDLKAPSGKTFFTDNLKIDKSAPALNNHLAHQPKTPTPNQLRFDSLGGG